MAFRKIPLAILVGNQVPDRNQVKMDVRDASALPLCQVGESLSWTLLARTSLKTTYVSPHFQNNNLRFFSQSFFVYFAALVLPVNCNCPSITSFCKRRYA